MKGITEMQNMICYVLKVILLYQYYFEIFAPCRPFQIRIPAHLFQSHFLKKRRSLQPFGQCLFALPTP